MHLVTVGRSGDDASKGSKVASVQSLACGQATAPRDDEQGVQGGGRCAQGCVPRGANGEMLYTSSRSGVQEIMRTIVTAKGDDDGPRGSRAHDQHG